MRWRLILIGVYPDYWMAFTYSDSLLWRIPRTTIHSTNQAFNAWFECLRRSFNPLIVYPPPLFSDGSSWIAWTLIEWRIAVYSICIPMDELLVTSWIHTSNRHSVSFFLAAFIWCSLWDTYLCEANGFDTFHVYVCACYLKQGKEDLIDMDFQVCSSSLCYALYSRCSFIFRIHPKSGMLPRQKIFLVKRMLL